MQHGRQPFKLSQGRNQYSTYYVPETKHSTKGCSDCGGKRRIQHAATNADDEVSAGVKAPGISVASSNSKVKEKHTE